jgi:uncharacterized protein (TIGR02302 family)
MTGRGKTQRALSWRFRRARAALLWERTWPALWPVLFVLGLFLVAALFDLLPALPGKAHGGVLAAFALALAAAAWRGWRAVSAGGLPDRIAARRRIERASGLSHRPLEALADRPSAPLDAPARALWTAHQQRMAAAVRRLRVGWPAAGLARRDPWGLRAVLAILLLLAAIDAGPDWRDRLAHALSPEIGSGTPTAAASFDLWLTPPEYTGLPPQFLRAGDHQLVHVPTGSVLLAQVHGGGAVPRLAIDDHENDFTAVDKTNFRFEAKLSSGKRLALTRDGVELGSWLIEIVPDNPPTIAFAKLPGATARAALHLDYGASDDYGVESVKAVIRRQSEAAGQAPGKTGSGAAAIELELPLPGLHLKNAEATSYHDLSPHPWAGLPVEIRLVASDALGQTGESKPVRMILPERVFHHPMARAIIDQRKELAKDPATADAVAEILGDLNKRPQLYGDDVAVFLALRLAQAQLRRDKSDKSIAAVEQLMWDTALRIEDGRLSVAERELRRLQQQLQDALAKGAPDAEIDRLMQQVQQALDRYLQSLAQDMQRHPDDNQTPIDPSRVLSGRDLQHMLDRARELARSGDREQARQLLSQLQNMLENLRTARPSQMQQQGGEQAQRMMRGLQDLMRRQQQLLDRSFQAQRQRGSQNRNGQPGQQQGEQSSQQQGQQSGEEQAQSGENGEMGDAAGEQEALRRGLGDIMRQFGEGSGEIPEPFGRAERAMRDAAGALRRGRPSQAIGPQTEALDQLQQAARDFAQQLQQRFGQGVPNGNGVGRADRDEQGHVDRDPFGRPMSNNGIFDQGDVKIPDESILQKSRRILDELRRRAGERYRPEIELDYIDRLLKRF